MDPPVAAEVETKSEKTEQAKSYDCGLCDTEVIYKIAQELLPGLASACVDSTTGGLFTSAGSVAVDMRKDMTDYLTQRSETYVAEFLLSENASMLELSEHPYDIVINLIDDFTSSKRNMFSRVSEWVLTDRREDRIDDFVQEMEINGFWLLARREFVASMLLKNVDYKNSFHCNMVCSSEEELVKHRSECMFRPMDCTSEGCTTRYCAAQKENHEAVCPFMVLPCEQKCSDFVMRREMDRHCVTVCPMKLVNCAFYTVGCSSNIPRCNVQQHNADELSSHLLYIIKAAHKDASDEDLKHRVEQILKLSNVEKLARARDTRALTFLIKDAEAKLGPLDVKTKPHVDSDKKESPTKTEPSVVKDGVDPPKKKEDNQGSQSAIETKPSTEKPVITEDKDKDKDDESPLKDEVIDNVHEEDGKQSTAKEDTATSPKGEKVKDESSNAVSGEMKRLSVSDEQETKKSVDEDKSKQLASSDQEDAKKSPGNVIVKESSTSDENGSKKSTTEETVKESSQQREKTQDSYGSDDGR
ncbi:putative homogentisate solanesyltransferase [Helianthus annuus]|nr:putative homogentisate solanesyltransferase [Helianthus annuus]KAJ0861531.1 putative homogentisate solanesyltransferase [Helianthus annuus]